MTALITLEDYWRKQFTLVVFGIASFDDAEALGEFLESRSAAKLVCVAVKQERSYDPDRKTPTDSGAYDSVAQRLKITFRELDTGDYQTFLIPAPLEDLFTIDQTPTSACIAAYKQMLEGLTGKTLLFVNGGLTSDPNMILH